MDSTTGDAPARRTAHIAAELARARADVVALSETRIHGKGSCQEGEFVFHWHGYDEGDRRQGTGGVGVVLSRNAQKELAGPPAYYSPRVMSVRFNFNLTFVSVYAPTFHAPESDKQEFYNQLQAAVDSAPRGNIVVIAGDFNARVGTNAAAWDGVMGPHGCGTENESGTRLLEFCCTNNLCVTNSYFQHPAAHQYTWKNPRSKRWHLLDYVLITNKHLSRVRDTRVFASVDVWSDHRYVGSTIDTGKWRPSRKPDRAKRRRANGAALRAGDASITVRSYQEAAAALLQNNPPAESCSVEQRWTHFKESLVTAVEQTVGFRKGAPQPDWWVESSDELQPLLEAKKATKHALDAAYLTGTPAPDRLVMLTKAHNRARNVARQAVRKAQNTWWSKKGQELTDAHNRKDMQTLFGFWKKLNVAPNQAHTTCGVRDTQGNMLTEPDAQLGRWREHFHGVLNLPSHVAPETIAAVPDSPVRQDMAAEPTLEEVQKAVHKLSSNKTAGKDEITAEMMKAGGPAVMQELHQLVVAVWRSEAVPQEWIDAVIIPLPKKGDKTLCDNWRGISLLSVAGKVFVKVIERRLAEFSEGVLSETQAGFRRGRGCTDMIFVARQLAEKARESNVRLLFCFFDLKKAYDTVNREAMWQLLSKYGIPDKMVALLKAMYTNMKATVELNGIRTDEFDVTNGLRQGCVISCTLFNLFFDRVMTEAREGYRGDVVLAYRTGLNLLGDRRFRRKPDGTRANEKLVDIVDMEFADDMGAPAHTEDRLQQFVTAFNEAATRWGLTVSIGKTQVLDQPDKTTARTTGTRPSPISINGQCLEEVSAFTYLGSTLTNDAEVDTEVTTRIGKACKVWAGLRGPVFNCKSLTASTKLQVFRGAVMPALLYGAETWPVREQHVRKIQGFVMRCLRQILRQPTAQRKPDFIILQEAKMQPVEILLRHARLRWLGHVQRMEPDRLPYQVLYGELKAGKRGFRKPPLRWKDCISTDLQAVRLGTAREGKWQKVAENRNHWRSHVANQLERDTKRWFQQRHVLRSARKGQMQNAEFVCKLCSKQFTEERFLKSHVTVTHTPAAAQKAEARRVLAEQQDGKQKALCPVDGCARVFTVGRGALEQHLRQTHEIPKERAAAMAKHQFGQPPSSSSVARKPTKAKTTTTVTATAPPTAPPTREKAKGTHACAVCQESFNLKQHLTQHINKTHKAETYAEPWDCPLAGCSKSFATPTSLKIHFSKTHGVKDRDEQTNLISVLTEKRGKVRS